MWLALKLDTERLAREQTLGKHKLGESACNDSASSYELFTDYAAESDIGTIIAIFNYCNTLKRPSEPASIYCSSWEDRPFSLGNSWTAQVILLENIPSLVTSCVSLLAMSSRWRHLGLLSCLKFCVTPTVKVQEQILFITTFFLMSILITKSTLMVKQP